MTNAENNLQALHDQRCVMNAAMIRARFERDWLTCDDLAANLESLAAEIDTAVNAVIAERGPAPDLSKYD